MFGRAVSNLELEWDVFELTSCYPSSWQSMVHHIILLGMIYKACVQSVLFLWEWDIGVRHERWRLRICIVWRKQRVHDGDMNVWSAFERQKAQCGFVQSCRSCRWTQSVADVVRHGRLRWLGHLKHKGVNNWVSANRNVMLAGWDVWAGVARLEKSVWKMTWNYLGYSLNEQYSGICK